jgi:hypothetical protein
MEQKTDFKIAYDGTWFHEGVRIQRDALAKLFSDKALKIDAAGDYWLQTPVEKYPVEVEDVPYIIIDFQEKGGDVDLITNMAETVPLGPEHPMVLKTDRKSGEILPYVEVRNGLYARLGRPVYYNLVQRFGRTIKSRGVVHKLGDMND